MDEREIIRRFRANKRVVAESYLDELRGVDGLDDAKRVGVTDVVLPCMRYVYYEKFLEEPIPDDRVDRIIVGKIFHFVPVFGEVKVNGGKVITEVERHEKVVWDDLLFGVSDDYDPDTCTLVDKKITRRLPSEPFHHHVLQVKVYAALLRKAGNCVDNAFILYYNPYATKRDGELKEKVFRVDLSDVDEVYRWARDRANTLKWFLENKQLPPPSPGWLCKFCPYWLKCSMDENPV